MKFAHMADCHIGGWREPKLRELNFKAFSKAVQTCIEKEVDFVLISGDLFNTSFPPLKELKETVTFLKKLKEKKIDVYIIAGSHDFSPSGKTILDVLEEADLFENVCKGEVIDGKLKLNFTINQRTGAKITGMLGKKGMLEKKYYTDLIKENLESEEGFKIFMFHTALDELKPTELEKMESCPASLLPKNFDYYAGGHVHIISKIDLDCYKNLIYPGPLMPNSFSEMEKLGKGGFYIYEDGKLEYQNIFVCNIHSIKINCELKTPAQIEEIILEEIKNKEFYNTIVTLRLFGKIGEGKTGEINWKKIYDEVYEKSAIFLMKNTNKLIGKDFEEIKISADTAEEIEQKLIKEHMGQSTMNNNEQEERIVQEFMKLLDLEKEEGEKVTDFETKIEKGSDSVMDNMF